MLQRVSPSTKTVQIGVFVYNPNSGEIAYKNRGRILPSGERVLFERLLEDSGKVVTFKELGLTYKKRMGTFPSYLTILGGITNLRFRLGTVHSDGPKYIHLAKGKGYALACTKRERNKISKEKLLRTMAQRFRLAYDKLYARFGRQKKTATA